MSDKLNNTGNRNTGFFNTVDQYKVQVFNGPMVDRSEFIQACPLWIFDPAPATWIYELDMSDQEKSEHPTFHTCGGYLRQNDWHDEWQKAYANASKEDIQKVRNLEGFDAEIFKEITGIDLSAQEKALPQEIEINGAIYTLKEQSE
jgi:hypothetical protein